MKARPRIWTIWTLLRQFKKIIFTGGSDNLLAKHSKAMILINFMTKKNSRHTRGLLTICGYKYVLKLGLRFGRCKEDVKAMLFKEGVTDPSKEQFNKSLDLVD